MDHKPSEIFIISQLWTQWGMVHLFWSLPWLAWGVFILILILILLLRQFQAISMFFAYFRECFFLSVVTVFTTWSDRWHPTVNSSFWGQCDTWLNFWSKRYSTTQRSEDVIHGRNSFFPSGRNQLRQWPIFFTFSIYTLTRNKDGKLSALISALAYFCLNRFTVKNTTLHAVSKVNSQDLLDNQLCAWNSSAQATASSRLDQWS